MNRGAELLKEWIGRGRGGQKRLADESGIDQGYLSRIISGERVPGLEVRRKLQGKPFHIPMQAWDEPVSKRAEERPTPTGTDGR